MAACIHAIEERKTDGVNGVRELIEKIIGGSILA
jgi:hypothetical protein